MSKYEYEYDENVELSIYHPIPQSFCLILWVCWSFSIGWTLKVLL